MGRALSPTESAATKKPRVGSPIQGDAKDALLLATKPSVHALLATVNGRAWSDRHQRIQKLLPPDVLRKTMTEEATDITGHDVYAKPMKGSHETRYDVVLNWQTNFWHVLCDIDGNALKLDNQVITDDGMMRSFYSERKGKMLDVGCNTGKNMMSAIKHSSGQIDAYGVEYSHDSVDLAAEALGQEHVFQADATKDFVTQHGWSGNFGSAICNFVLQHMDPEGVDAVLGNIAKSLTVGGEFLTTFKDAPTQDQMEQCGMADWSGEVFTADLADKDAYLNNGFLHTVIWDDDYYPGVTSKAPPIERNLHVSGPHRRELYFYGLKWMKEVAKKHGLIAREVAVVCDAKIPFSVFSWKVIFVKE
jgi:SAM-dependent methyltransferase